MRFFTYAYPEYDWERIERAHEEDLGEAAERGVEVLSTSEVSAGGFRGYSLVLLHRQDPEDVYISAEYMLLDEANQDMHQVLAWFYPDAWEEFQPRFKVLLEEARWVASESSATRGSANAP